MKFEIKRANLNTQNFHNHEYTTYEKYALTYMMVRFSQLYIQKYFVTYSCNDFDFQKEICEIQQNNKNFWDFDGFQQEFDEISNQTGKLKNSKYS